MNTNVFNLQRFPTDVDQHRDGASPYGVMDMLGNVWEWTCNAYVHYPYTVGGPHESLLATGRRVLRGGSYNAKPNQIRSSMRLRQNAGKAEINMDFELHGPCEWQQCVTAKHHRQSQGV